MASKTSSKTSIFKIASLVLVIIALCIAGIFGYKLFSKKAENSRALSELKGVQEVMLTELASTTGGKDKTVTCDGVTFYYEWTKGRVSFKGSLETDDDGNAFTIEIKNSFDELHDLDGSFSLEDDVITYTVHGGKAYWKSGKLPSSYK